MSKLMAEQRGDDCILLYPLQNHMHTVGLQTESIKVTYAGYVGHGIPTQAVAV